ncbi:MAG TPA: hypothetical protein VET90_06845, partial [Candidatus Binatus sp.]|nr:hypothetical protein [Candidatus Binatus sp.]
MDRPTDVGPGGTDLAAGARLADRPADTPASAAPDRRHSIYLGGCRVDVVRRGGTARLLSDRRLGLAVVRALEAAGAPTPASVTVVLTDDDELRDL